MPTSKPLCPPLILILGAIFIPGALFAMLGLAGPASAATDPQPTATVSDRTPKAGSTVTFCGSGFEPGENMEIRFVDLELGAVVDASGDFCKTFPLVADKGLVVTGPQSIAALGTRSGRGASVEIVIAAAGGTGVPPASGDGQLAFTGPAVGPVGALGGLLLVVGAMMVLTVRPRKIVA